MKDLRVMLLLMLFFLCASTAGKKTGSTAPSITKLSNEGASAQSDFFPVMRFPDKGKFITTEEDPFLVSIEALCAPGATDTAMFELLPPTPNFVNFFDTCRGNALSHAMIAIVPKKGDAGKYTVAVRAINCEGKGGVFTFTVKVRRE